MVLEKGDPPAQSAALLPSTRAANGGRERGVNMATINLEAQTVMTACTRAFSFVDNNLAPGTYEASELLIKTDEQTEARIRRGEFVNIYEMAEIASCNNSDHRICLTQEEVKLLRPFLAPQWKP